MDYQKLTLRYFTAFSEKNLQKIGQYLHLEVKLRDWEFETHGKPSTLDFFESIFEKCTDISVELKQIRQFHSTCYCHLIVTIDEASYDVLDVISFDGHLIAEISAYRQF
jgi:hypothetical protein